MNLFREIQNVLLQQYTRLKFSATARVARIRRDTHVHLRMSGRARASAPVGPCACARSCTCQGTGRDPLRAQRCCTRTDDPLRELLLRSSAT